MKTVSNEFKQSAIAPVKEVGAIVTIFADPDVQYTSDNQLQSVTFESTGELFGSVATQVTVKLLGNDYDYVGKELSIVYTLKVGENTESISFGNFTIQSQTISKNKEYTEFVAINKMMELQNLNYQEVSGFPMTVGTFAQRIATVNSVNLESMTGLPNINFQIQQDLYKTVSGSNYRSVCAEIAGATATMAVLDNTTNTLKFRPYQSAVQQTMNYSYLKKYEIGEHYGAINTLVLSRTPQEDNIVVKDETMVETDGEIAVKLANNQILDNDRQTLITPIFNAIKGMEWDGIEIETVGLGWLECGDRIKIIDDSSNEIEAIITYIKLTIDGGVKEIIKGVPPVKTETNYALAGGITKTIYNTEIKVDKQNQQIISIVEEQTQFEQQTTQNFTNITQNVSSVVTSVQQSGGNNIIKNSAFFVSDDNGNFTNWTYTAGLVVEPSGEADANGSLSGQVIRLGDKSISQAINVKADESTIAEADKTYYSFNCRAKKSTAGTASITITDGTEEGVWTIAFPNGTGANWEEYYIDKILPQSPNLTITAVGSSGSEFILTDMMINVGSYHSQWQQASGESSNTQVSITTDGITVKNGNTASSFTKHTNQGFVAYKNRQATAQLNSDEVIAPKAEFKTEIDMKPVKIIAQNDGWAFVAMD